MATLKTPQTIGGEITKQPHNDNYALLKANDDALNADVSNLENQDAINKAELQANIDAEEQSRIAGDETLDTRIDNIIAQSGTSDTEVVDARTSTTLGETFTVLKDRFENIESDLLADSTLPHTQNLSLEDLPVGAKDSPISDLDMEFVTLVNEVENGDFSNGTTGWASVGSPAVTVGAEEVEITSNIAGDGIGRNNINYSVGDEWFFYTQMKGTKFELRIRTSSLGGATDYATGDLTYSEYTEVYFTHTIALPTSASIQTAGDGVNAYYIKKDVGIVGVNKTALGIESYTEEQMLSLVRQGYFEGMSTNETSVLFTRGKNLFDGSYFLKGAQLNSNNTTTTNVNVNITNYIEVDELTTYFNNLSIGSGTTGVNFYDSNFNFIGYENQPVLKGDTFTTISGTKYIRANVLSNNFESGIEDTLQLEKGTVATAYEPHKSSILSLDGNGGSVPNGVADRVFYADGELWLEKNTVEYEIKASDIESINTTPTNLDRLTSKATPFENAKYGNVKGLIHENGYTYTTDITTDTTENTNVITWSASSGGRFYINVPKGTYANLAEAQADLAGTKVRYQLTTPQLINLTEQGLASGQLLSFENGSMSVDAYFAELTAEIATNRASVIDKTVEGVNANAKALTSKADKVQDGWIEPTLLNGWVNFGSSYATAGFYKDDMGVVRLKGTIKSGVATAGTTLFILPTGYRPLNEILNMPCQSADSFGGVRIDGTGSVYIRAGVNTAFSLDGIAFRAEG